MEPETAGVVHAQPRCSYAPFSAGRPLRSLPPRALKVRAPDLKRRALRLDPIRVPEPRCCGSLLHLGGQIRIRPELRLQSLEQGIKVLPQFLDADRQPIVPVLILIDRHHVEVAISRLNTR